MSWFRARKRGTAYVLSLFIFCTLFYLLGTRHGCSIKLQNANLQMAGKSSWEKDAGESPYGMRSAVHHGSQRSVSPCIPLVASVGPTTADESVVGGKFMQEMAEERSLAEFTLQPRIADESEHLKACANSVSADVSPMIVHLIKSAIGNKDRRKAIRETWGAIKSHRGFRNEIVFVVGLSKDQSVNDDLRREHDKFGDILQLSEVDGANLVPEKVVAGMQWASSKLRENVLYTSVDDDILVHIPNLVKYIKDTYTLPQLPESSIPCYEDLPIICTYSYQDKDIPSRNPKSKWFMPREWYPNDTWPRYCRGGMYVAPVKIVRGLFEASKRTARLYLDDVWVTGFMRRKLGKGDSNIVAAPYSQRNDHQLQNEKDDPNDVIVRHMWGNIEGKPVKVAQVLTQHYAGWTTKMDLNATCLNSS